MKLFPAVMAFVAGLLAVVQVAMNAQLRASFGHALVASAFNFAVGLASLVGVVLLLRLPLPSATQVLATPTWAWLGGMLGATFVAILAFASRDLGALFAIGLVVAGQMVASIAVDHYGLLGFPVRPFSYAKLLGCAMFVAGLVLMRRG
jgi:transporter family-2 protein